MDSTLLTLLGTVITAVDSLHTQGVAVNVEVEQVNVKMPDSSQVVITRQNNLWEVSTS